MGYRVREFRVVLPLETWASSPSGSSELDGGPPRRRNCPRLPAIRHTVPQQIRRPTAPQLRVGRLDGSLPPLPQPSVSSLLLRPSGACSCPAFHPRLTPLRQAQGKLWALFLRRFAAAMRLPLFTAGSSYDTNSAGVRSAAERPKQVAGKLILRCEGVLPAAQQVAEKVRRHATDDHRGQSVGDALIGIVLAQNRGMDQRTVAAAVSISGSCLDVQD